MIDLHSAFIGSYVETDEVVGHNAKVDYCPNIVLFRTRR